MDRKEQMRRVKNSIHNNNIVYSMGCLVVLRFQIQYNIVQSLELFFGA